MNWEVIIPIFISIIAVWVAISSKNAASKASQENLEIQKRMEVNQFYPIIDLAIDMENHLPRLVINNRSDINSASDYSVKYVLRIFAKNMNVDLEGEDHGKEIPANSKEFFLNNTINDYVKDSMPFIKRTEPEKLHIVLRYWVQYKASHPDSMPMSDEVVTYLTYSQGKLTLKNV